MSSQMDSEDFARKQKGEDLVGLEEQVVVADLGPQEKMSSLHIYGEWVELEEEHPSKRMVVEI